MLHRVRPTETLGGADAGSLHVHEGYRMSGQAAASPCLSDRSQGRRDFAFRRRDDGGEIGRDSRGDHLPRERENDFRVRPLIVYILAAESINLQVDEAGGKPRVLLPSAVLDLLDQSFGHGDHKRPSVLRVSPADRAFAHKGSLPIGIRIMFFPA